MYNPTTRLLTILELLQSRGAMSGSELAGILEVEERSVRRYIMMLRDMGIPIESERGRYGSYHLRPGYRMPPLMFNGDEIVAVVLGLMLTRELGLTDSTAISSATAKIERVLPDELRLRAEAISSTLTIALLRVEMYAIPPDRLIAFSLAAYTQKCLRIHYVSAKDETTERMIAPYGLVFHAGAWYAPAHCHLRDDTRTFRLDRVRAARLCEESFTPPTAFDVKGFVFETIARMAGTYRFEVIFGAPLATVQDAIPPTMAILEEWNAETRMICYSENPMWLARFLVRIDLPFRIVDSEALRTALRRLAEEMTRWAER